MLERFEEARKESEALKKAANKALIHSITIEMQLDKLLLELRIRDGV